VRPTLAWVLGLAQAMLGVLGGEHVAGGVAGGGRDGGASGEASGEVSVVGVGNQQLVGDYEIPSGCHRTSWLSQAPVAPVTLSSPSSQPTGMGSESSPRNWRLVS
jgi:hypothetical protein